MDAGKIGVIVADMRKVLAKNPHIEQQKLHRRVFFEKIDPKNQALMVIIHLVIPSFGWNTIAQSVLTKNSDHHWYIFFRCHLIELSAKDPTPTYCYRWDFYFFDVNLACLLFMLPDKLTLAVRTT